MKVVLLVIGALGSIYCLFGVIQLFGVLRTTNPGSTFGGTQIIAAIVAPLIGLVVALVCFSKALGKKIP